MTVTLAVVARGLVSWVRFGYEAQHRKRSRLIAGDLITGSASLLVLALLRFTTGQAGII